MPEQPYEFGRELRRRRLAAQWSLERLGQSVHYSKAQLSKVERGLKRPTPELSRLCDTVLGAGGALAALVPGRSRATGLPNSDAHREDAHHEDARQNDAHHSGTHRDDEVWLMRLGKDGTGSFRPMNRRRVLTAGAVSVLAIGVGGVQITADTGATTLVDAHRSMFDQFRRLGQLSGPGGVLPPLIAQTHSLEQQAARSGPATRRELLVLASRYAEYAGWMAQESGNDGSALWWTDRAVELATAGGDRELAVYALVRRALVSLFRGDTAAAIGLSDHALASPAPPRIRGLAAQHLAQSHAVAGDHDACMRSLDRSRELLALDAADPSSPVIGASHLPDVVSMFTGWCLYELGHPRRAAEALDRETARLPADALRTRARYGVRRALAHAAAGEIEEACAVTRGLLDAVGLVRSATITADLRRLARVLGRHPRSAAVRGLAPDLSSLVTQTSL
ncbi:helix-turn-helix domain-containing protein [Streptomyces sp. NPDC057654]|uniref:helix-turn-helix domain-containing protein n=1 Tax=Streptomyces sp. NPDC057654 TaxID=3346196 RepID=UPI00367A091E